MDATPEVELKLEFDPGDRKRLGEAPLFNGLESRVDHLVSTYFDTADLDLLKAGYSLRVRRKGRDHVQTIKADGAAAGLFVRSEWERPVEGNVPIVDPVPDAMARAVGADGIEAVRKIFVTDVERAVHRLQQDGDAVECAIDIGRIRSGRHAAALAEIELELLAGEPAVLFAIARQLNARVPLRLGVRSKSERGYALMARAARAAAKAEPIALAQDVRTQDAFRIIVQACIRQFRLNEDLLLATGAPDALHQARVGIRRLRSALSLFKPLIGQDPAVPSLKQRLRRLAGALGAVRDLDVLIPTVADRFRPLLVDRRAVALGALETCLRAVETRQLMLDLAEWLAVGDWCIRPVDPDLLQGEAVALARIILDDRRKRLARKARHFAKLGDARRHRVRIEAKKLRYASEFFGSLFPGKGARKRHRRFSKTLANLQDDLGDLNDRVTASATLAAAGIDVHLATLGGKARGRLLHHAAHGLDRLFDRKRFWR